MKEPRKSIFNWNHISDELTKEQIEELKSYYQTYHKKCWAHKQALKSFKNQKLLGNSLSIIFASGGVASSIATGGVSLIAITTVALLIQGWISHKNLDLKIENCTYAHQSYQHLLNEIKDMMRSGNFYSSHIYNMMKNIDDYVTDNRDNRPETEEGGGASFVAYAPRWSNKRHHHHVTDNSPIVDKYLIKYDEKFIR